MVKRVTIRDVAREAGVSIALVSFVMNRDHRRADGSVAYRVSDETVARITEIAERLNYHPNSAASSLRSGRTRTIGVVVSDIANRFFSDIVRYIENVAYSAGYTVLCASTDEQADKLESMLSVLTNKGVDGLIIATCSGGADAVSRVVDSGLPVVLLDRDIAGLDVSRVMLDNVRAGAMGVGKLYANGYRRIELVSYDMGISSIGEREEGYRRAMREVGLQRFARIHRTTYGNVGDSVTRIVSDAVGRGVEAMIFPTNTLSLYALQAVNALGLKIPNDMAMICFDDNEVFDLYNPTIARIGQSVEMLGVRSFELLREKIECADTPSSTYIVEPQFIDGLSSVPRLTDKKHTPKIRNYHPIHD